MREDQLTFLVLCTLNVNLYLVADLQIRVVAEFRSGDDTVALVADVDNYLLLVNRDYCALYYLMVGNLVQGFVVSLVELFLANISNCSILELVPIKIVEWLNVLC